MTPAEKSHSEALAKACRVVGSQSALAALLGGKVKQAHVFYWLETGRIPAQHCPTIERETAARGDVVRCEELNSQADWAVLRRQALESHTPAEHAG
ncbi:MAG: transcriptional regulator [Burkholderiales bacterium]|nr:MAG: transcriptional regulator [Burkholderiales bacterium]